MTLGEISTGHFVNSHTSIHTVKEALCVVWSLQLKLSLFRKCAIRTIITH